ncbi:nitroreductase family protein [Streptomyces aidingensis]|uniref:Nitroreductase n=1 Tax=Streptomyces aidingensis TaxID=910347 RepID=A0A1I1SDA2_9ACTN|nr:nitroreductase family protein [Streptomyces aidingensis]SFD40970.1 Nitroreductase [Streptomyces aidingensis]
MEPTGEGEEVLRVLRGRAVVRRYTAEPVDDALLDRLLEVTVTAPTAANKQAWGFLAVRAPRMVRCLRAFAPGMIGLPPLVVVACFDRDRAVGEPAAPWDAGMLCVAMAVENLLLAAHAVGLGGCPVSSFDRAAVRRLVRLPPALEPLLLVPLGRPARIPEPAARRERSEVIRYESWD